MAKNKLSFSEGTFINRPPLFESVNYQFRKVKMKIVIESIDQCICDAIINGSYVPKHMINNKLVDKPWVDWSKIENNKAQYDCMAKKIITSILNVDEFFKVSQCTSTKEMLDILGVTHEAPQM